MSKYPKILMKENYDRIVLVTNSTLFLLLKNKKLADKYKNKVIYYLHNEVRSLFGCAKEANSIYKLIGISQFVNNSFKKLVPMLDEKKFSVLKNGVDTENFMNKDDSKITYYRKKFGIKENDFVVIFAGRLVKEKGALEVLRAVKKCKDNDIKLLIVGSGFYSSDIVDEYALKLKEESVKLQNNVIFTGYIDYFDMPSIYHIGNVAVLPSIWDEPAGMTMVEAVISGLPLITTNSGGIPEYISDELAVFLERNEFLVDNIADEIMKVKLNNIDKTRNREFAKKKLADEINLCNFYAGFTDLAK